MSSSLLIQTSEEDPWVASAQYVGSILEKSGESSSAAEAYANSIRAAYASENLSQVLDLFLAKLQVVYTNTESDQDLEGFTNVCTHLPPRCENSTQAASQLAAALSADPTNRPERRLQGLINLYNTVVEPSSKLHVLLAIMAFAKASSLADILLNVVKGSIDSWIKTLDLSNIDQRTLLVACADSLESCTRKPKTAAREAYRLRIRALKTYKAADVDAQGLEIAAKVVKEYIVSPDLFQFDVADIPAVKALASSSEHGAMYAILKLFLDGTVKEFRAFMASNGKAVLAAIGSAEDALLGKMMLMALVGLVNRRSSVSFKEIADSLDLSSNSDVENLIVRAIGKKLLEAKIDQLAEVVVVSKCSSRKFERAEWEGLSVDVKEWRHAIEDVLTLGTESKTALFAGLEKLDDGFNAKAMQA